MGSSPPSLLLFLALPLPLNPTAKITLVKCGSDYVMHDSAHTLALFSIWVRNKIHMVTGSNKTLHDQTPHNLSWVFSLKSSPATSPFIILPLGPSCSSWMVPVLSWCSFLWLFFLPENISMANFLLSIIFAQSLRDNEFYPEISL